MDGFKNYSIPLNGLQPGKYEYDFKVDDNFFAGFENSEVKGGNAVVNVLVDKAGSNAKLTFNIRGEAVVQCDRCLEDCTLPVDYEGELTVRTGNYDDSYDGETLWRNSHSADLNVAQYIYESIELSLPYQRHHDDKDNLPGCDPEMLEKFRIVSEEEFATLTSGEQQTLEENPQFQKLKELRKNLEKD